MTFLYKSFILYLFVVILSVTSFSPELSSFDEYALKLAANNILLVESIPSDYSFFLRLAPFNYSLSCTIPYNDSNQYVFAVAVDPEATYNNSVRFVFIGIDKETDIPFIGTLTYVGVTGESYVAATKSSRKSCFSLCGVAGKQLSHTSIQSVCSNETNENNNNDFFVVTVAPRGNFAYAFTNSFLVMYDLNRNIVSTQLGNNTWPDPTFLPYAVDVDRNLLFVILGYVGDSNTKFTPCAYLLNISNSAFHVLDTWSYVPSTSTSWQASLTNRDADVYAEKYSMSVSINNAENQVVFGIQIINTIVILDINRANRSFSAPLQTLSNGKAIGMGKAVGWFDRNIILVLVNTNSLNYIWSSSQIFAYDVTVANRFTVTSIFPNMQQPLAPAFGPILESLVITRDGTVVILDSEGNYYILLPSPAGSFSDTSSGTSSSFSPCTAGTYSPKPDVFSCSLCPPDTTTNGPLGQHSCVPCMNDTFCPLGAAFGNIRSSSSLFMNVNQGRAYPVSPQSTRFDNILIQNMFQIHNTTPHRCLIVSPLFWTIIVIVFGLGVWLLIFILGRAAPNSKGRKAHEKMKHFLKKTDLIGEGEVVIGGLFSFSIIVLVTFAYVFSSSYFQRYPIEDIHGDARFACDPTLTNAQFSSGLMATGITPNDDEAPIFMMLDAQPFTLHVDFINTLFNCTDITALQIKDINLPMAISSCNESDSIVSISLLLPSHSINLQVLLAGSHTVGALRISLEGPGMEAENQTLEADYTLVDLMFSQALFVSGRLLTQQPSCALQLTKVINRTYPRSEDEETEFSGLWLPSFSGTLDQMFVDENEYKYATSSTTALSIVITETSYYVMNTQKPITDEDELIFTNLLFTIVCLEIFGLGFLIAKILIIPSLKRLWDCCHGRASSERSSRSSLDLLQTPTTRM